MNTPSLIEQIVAARGGNLENMFVEVSRYLPYESMDPKKPGTIHAVRVASGIFNDGPPFLLVSQECWDALLKHSEEAS